MESNVIHKSALLILNRDRTALLGVRKMDKTVPHWLLPGGRIEEGESIEEALVREIQEELSCEIVSETMEFISTYSADAAGRPGKVVRIELFRAEITGNPVASSEIVELGWLTREAQEDELVSDTIRFKLIPDLIKKGILL